MTEEPQKRERENSEDDHSCYCDNGHEFPSVGK